MIGGNAYVTGKTALASHMLNLAAEPTDAGATVNAYRPSFVETVMPAESEPRTQQRSAENLRQRFIHIPAQGALITPDCSVRPLVAPPSRDSGQIWIASKAPG